MNLRRHIFGRDTTVSSALRAKVQPVVAESLRLLLGLILLLSSIAKAIEFPSFVTAVRALHLVPPSLEMPAATAVVLAEFVSALMLLLKLNLPVACVFASALLLLFSGVIVRAEIWETVTDCGCFGKLMERKTDWAALSENIVAVLILLILRWYYRKDNRYE
jgi:uncharacterized membrane protein YphA (DoxX/SURF4 family)